MRIVSYIILVFLLLINTELHSQRGHKGDGSKKGGGKKEKADIKIKNDNVHIKVKSNGNNSVKIKGNNGGPGHDNGWHHGHHKHEKHYGPNTILWFYGPGDIYAVKGKDKKQKIVVFDGVCIRLGKNIGFMFGMIGNIRLKLDSKKGKWKPEKVKKMKVEIDLLEEELKLIEIKKNKIKVRLGKL